MKFSESDYRPLVKGLTIKDSSLHGLGLFTTIDWDPHVYLGITHYWHDNKHMWTRTPLGGFINHSDDPNCFVHEDINGGVRELFIVKPVKAGEELTVFYSNKLGYGKGN